MDPDETAFNDPKIASLQRYILVYAFLPRDSSNEWLWIAKRKQADKTMTNVVDQSVRKQNCRLCRLWMYTIYFVDLSLERGRRICKGYNPWKIVFDHSLKMDSIVLRS